MEEARLSIRNIGKAYNVPVLRGLNLDLQRGEIHGLVGENGAGKSTLINILAGLVAADSGQIRIDGDAYAPDSAAAAFAAGVAFAAQELSGIETLTVAENIALRHLPSRAGIIRRNMLFTIARDLLDRVGLAEVSPVQPLSRLSLGEKQLVEIARTLLTDSRLLMFDEPTAALTAQQAEVVHALLADLAEAGTSVIYVSHRLEDVLRVADRVSVLRDGELVTTRPSAEVDSIELVELMSGARQEPEREQAQAARSSQPSLRAKDARTGDIPDGFDIELRAGEITGLAGLAGAGKSELLEALFGLVAVTDGEIQRIDGRTPADIRTPGEAVRNGIGYLGEDRRTMGIFPGTSVTANMMLPDLRRASLNVIDRRDEDKRAMALCGQLSVQYDTLEQDIRQLSGGNQQKVLLARWLNCDADVLLLDEPTRGVDVATKFAIHRLFADLAASGKTLLVASSELDELMAICDRILVMSNRRLAASFAADDWTESAILAAAFSGYAAEARRMEQRM